ncbi:O-antigen polymerase [Bacillus sp. 31A1R]|uniref:O-antigen polymerase n=1 Tax=Robertmurraya mangrovi TaxID=3098077 RepID=A0ABU5ITI4_9BACI|nr:O-antigen polymerase [Bacillus sp. 31A1R]MDZ5470444.1 O-antigen polymerase [Bacillus sp. 31A1R]
MGYYSVVFSLISASGVLIFEIFRPKNRIIDFLTGVNFVYWMTFGIVPLYIFLFYEYTTWSTIRKLELTSVSYLLASIYSLVGYLCIIFSYYYASRFSINVSITTYSMKKFNNIRSIHIFKVALILFVLGFTSLVAYIRLLGGLESYLNSGLIIRSGFNTTFTSPFMFLKNLVPLLYISSYYFYCLMIEKRENLTLNVILFLTAFISSLMHLYHGAGRMTFFIYLISFPLGHIVLKNRINFRFIIVSIWLFFVMVVLGDHLLSPYSTQSIWEVFKKALLNLGGTVGGIIEEFSSPFVNLANNIEQLSIHYHFRYGFKDFIIGLNGILPSRFLPFEYMKQPNIDELNTLYFQSAGSIPVDLITFGYITFGLAGVIIITLIFGVLIRFIEGLLSNTNNIMMSITYSSWMIFIAFRVMYAEPGLVYNTVFKLVLALFLLLYFIRNNENERN